MAITGEKSTNDMELQNQTPEYMLLPKMRFKLSLSEFWGEEELKNSFLDIIKRNNMAPYYQEVCQDLYWEMDTNLYEEMRATNVVTWTELEARNTNSNLEDENTGNWREMLEYACKIGDIERATNICTSVFENTSHSSGIRAEAAFGLFRVAYFKSNVSSMGTAVRNINDLMEVSCKTGSNWCCRNKLKAYEALYCLAIRNFARATSLLLDCIPTFESYELLSFKDVVQYTVLAGMISLSRSELDNRFNNNGILQQALIMECSAYRDYLNSFYDCHYADFFQHLAWIELEMKFDPLLRPHYQYYVREMRIKAYSQLLQAYRTLSLNRMAIEFGVTEEYMEQEMARFIANGRLHCKIDKVSGTVVTVSASGCDRGQSPNATCDRGLIYQNTIKRGDTLLNRLKKLGQPGMAHRVFLNRSGIITKPINNVKQKFKYLLVLDFEATCEKGFTLTPQEIIEFPCMVLDTHDWKVKNVFHKYVRPKVHPDLTPFCTSLTGIIQDMVDDEPHFPVVFSSFCTWLKDNGYFEPLNKSAFVTCGNWDLKIMLPNQCAIDNLPVPQEFKQWINLKDTFCEFYHYFPRGLVDMLSHLKLPMIGRLHSGISDTENMVRIIQVLSAMHKPEFKITNKLDEKKTLP
ncbi:hypothetical protein KPH14_002298 [Odynerus spinipes]|uniref:26S proteasome non-ATPase regulatory subunit 6 n=1 Tax=Odynerus spinipes TaxID=1348599 RepID=A0AAD9RLD0_9HYME|nr:hypothetical protein KPH14_002298 [Odynerus spinipes]